VDYLSISPSATGSPGNVTIAAAGSDTDVGIALTPKGAGGVGIGTTSATALLDVRQTSTATSGTVNLQNAALTIAPGSTNSGTFAANNMSVTNTGTVDVGTVYGIDNLVTN